MFNRNIFKLVTEFNKKVVKVPDRNVHMLGSLETTWLADRLVEEAHELEVASTLVDQVDALLDSMYYAIGGLVRAGLTPKQMDNCFRAVHAANMTKHRGTRAFGVKHPEGADAVKLDNWEGPENIIRMELEL
jgi:predicted HAD superfamily Cof-like phosphohydrolase